MVDLETISSSTWKRTKASIEECRNFGNLIIDEGQRKVYTYNDVALLDTENTYWEASLCWNLVTESAVGTFSCSSFYYVLKCQTGEANEMFMVAQSSNRSQIRIGIGSLYPEGISFGVDCLRWFQMAYIEVSPENNEIPKLRMCYIGLDRIGYKCYIVEGEYQLELVRDSDHLFSHEELEEIAQRFSTLCRANNIYGGLYKNSTMSICVFPVSLPVPDDFDYNEVEATAKVNLIDTNLYSMNEVGLEIFDETRILNQYDVSLDTIKDVLHVLASQLHINDMGISRTGHLYFALTFHLYTKNFVDLSFCFSNSRAKENTIIAKTSLLYSAATPSKINQWGMTETSLKLPRFEPLPLNESFEELNVIPSLSHKVVLSKELLSLWFLIYNQKQMDICKYAQYGVEALEQYFESLSDQQKLQAIRYHDKRGKTALMWACQNSMVAETRYLLLNGASLEQRRLGQKSTAWEWAAIYSRKPLDCSSTSKSLFMEWLLEFAVENQLPLPTTNILAYIRYRFQSYENKIKHAVEVTKATLSHEPTVLRWIRLNDNKINMVLLDLSMKCGGGCSELDEYLKTLSHIRPNKNAIEAWAKEVINSEEDNKGPVDQFPSTRPKPSCDQRFTETESQSGPKPASAPWRPSGQGFTDSQSRPKPAPAPWRPSGQGFTETESQSRPKPASAPWRPSGQGLRTRTCTSDNDKSDKK